MTKDDDDLPHGDPPESDPPDSDPPEGDPAGGDPVGGDPSPGGAKRTPPAKRTEASGRSVSAGRSAPAGRSAVSAVSAVSVLARYLTGPSVPLDVGRTYRSVPSWIRAALLVRDQHCAFPGCDRPPHWCQAHHIQHWADDGPTALSNLVLLCPHHHNAVHHDGWTVQIDPDTHLPAFTPPPATHPHDHARTHDQGRRRPAA